MNKRVCKILISACLLGEKVRYDAKQKKVTDPLIKKWHSQGILLPVCPEVLGGLATPRPAAEIQIDGSVKTNQGTDVTAAFKCGAEKTLALAIEHQINIVILTERSPSCGSSNIYDGRFSRTIIAGQGITTKRLRDNNIHVFNQFQLAQVEALLERLDS